MSKINFEQYLETYGELTYKNKGVSMLPMLVEGRDLFTLKAKTEERCKKYDVILYRRGKDYVLHRVVGVREKDYVVLGDNCLKKEYGITDQDILGVLSEFQRKGKTYSVEDRGYMLYAKLWYKIYPLRMFLKRVKGKLFNAAK